jgi:hypothetical protein
MTRVGRTVLTSAITIPNVATGSAYSAYDAVGSAFQIPLAVGDEGGLVAQLNAFDRGTANAPLRFHFFSTAFTPTPNGDTFAVAASDEPHYLGYIDVGAANWFTAGAGKNQARIIDQNIGLYGAGVSRSVWGQAATPGTPTFGNSTNPLTFSLVFLQD